MRALIAGILITFAAFLFADEPGPAPAAEWVKVNDCLFSGRKLPKDYYPYYVIQAGNAGLYSRAKTIKWKHYADEEPVIYKPDKEFLLDCSRVFDRWVRLSRQTPHEVKWVIEIEAAGGADSLRCDPNGIVISTQADEMAFALDPAVPHTVSMERKGDALTFSLDGEQHIVLEVDPDDREPLRVTAQKVPALIRSSKLFFAAGAKLETPPPPAPKDQVRPEWDVVYQEDFAKPVAMQPWVGWPDAGTLEWADKEEALRMGPDREAGSDEKYVLLRRSLPGDVRISFRARSILPKQPAFFGLLLDIKGRLKKEDGYFIEWNYWQVQIKKKNTRVAGFKRGYPQPIKANGWMKFAVQRVNGVITMYTEGTKVLEWKDPYPYKDNGHDLFCLYTWRVPMEFDDFLIERNIRDQIPSRPDQPVFKENYLNGDRDGDPGEEEIPIDNTFNDEEDTEIF